MPFCSHCGTRVEDGQRFCANCGKPCTVPIMKENTQPAQENVNPEAPAQEENANSANEFYNQAFTQQTDAQYWSEQTLNKFPIEKRSLPMCIILTLITCGIYGIYWYYCLIRDMTVVSGKKDELSPGMTVLVTIITCGIYGCVWFYRAGEKMDKIKKNNGTPLSIIYLIVSVIPLFDIVDYCLIQDDLNKLSEDE